MPIEVKELIIKATVQEPDAKKGAGGKDALSQEAKDELIQACVEKVMRMLRDKKER